MFEKKRIIPCLDIKDGRVIKGVNFVNFKDAGDPVKQAEFYCEAGADALVFLDIMATNENRETMIELVQLVASRTLIPFTVGGGIRTAHEAEQVFNAGANRISINTAAVKRPVLINEIANQYGSHRLTVAIDAIRDGKGSFSVLINGGMTDTGMDAVVWAKEAAKRGCSEILLTSRDRDGMKNGYDIEMTKAVAKAVNVPVIASGGAGNLSDFYEVLTEGCAEGALAASLFHFRKIEVLEVKKYLKERGVSVYGIE